jgi:hypothetical protein
MSETPLEFARKILRQWKPDIDLDGGEAGVKNLMKAFGRGFLFAGRNAEGRPVLYTTEKRKEEEVDALLNAADQDPVAFEVACEVAADDLRDGLLPELSLRKFAADVLSGKITKPPQTKGPKRYGNLRRNRCFAYICDELIKSFGCHPYRNPASRENLQKCACDIVREAARLEGLDATYEAVSDAYKKESINFPQSK